MNVRQIYQNHSNYELFIENRDPLRQNLFVWDVVGFSLVHFESALENIRVVNRVLKDDLDLVELFYDLRSKLVIMNDFLEHREQWHFL